MRTLLIALSLVGSLTTSSLADERLRDFHILGIGINEYAAGKHLHLNKSVESTFQLCDYLTKQDVDVGKVESEKVPRAPRYLFDDKATKAAIEHELAELPNWVADRSTVAIVYTGHGWRTGGEWYLCPHDSNLAVGASSMVSASQMMRAIDVLIAKKKCRVLVVLNACHSGQFVTAAEPYLDKYRDAEQGGIIIVASCIPQQPGWETGMGNVFGETLLQGLKLWQAHREATSAISVRELRLYLRREMQSQVKFMMWKTPGSLLPEQTALVECSWSIPESQGLTWAPRLPARATTGTEPESPAPPRMSAVKTDRSPVGMWICERPFVAKFKEGTYEPEVFYVDEEGQTILGIVVLKLSENGEYEVAYEDRLGQKQEGRGRYRFESGVGLTFTYDTGIDYFSVDQLTEDELVLRDPHLKLPAGVLEAIGKSNGQSDPVWRFRRAEVDKPTDN